MKCFLKVFLRKIIDRNFTIFFFVFRDKTEKTTTQTAISEKEPDEPINYKNVVMSIYSPVVKSGPCKYLDGTRKQNHQCRRDSGLPEALREAKKLALTHCEEQFKYDRWNCSIETRGKRNIFKKVCSQFLLAINKRILKDSNKYIP